MIFHYFSFTETEDVNSEQEVKFVHLLIILVICDYAWVFFKGTWKPLMNDEVRKGCYDGLLQFLSVVLTG